MDDMTPEAALRLLDMHSIRSIREALIETLPPQSAAREKLADIEAKAETERGKINARNPDNNRPQILRTGDE